MFGIYAALAVYTLETDTVIYRSHAAPLIYLFGGVEAGGVARAASGWMTELGYRCLACSQFCLARR